MQKNARRLCKHPSGGPAHLCLSVCLSVCLPMSDFDRETQLGGAVKAISRRTMRWGKNACHAGRRLPIKSARNPRPKIHRDVLNVNDFGPHTCVDLFNVRRALLAQFESDAAQPISQFQSTSHDVGIDGKRAPRRQVARYSSPGLRTWPALHRDSERQLHFDSKFEHEEMVLVA